MCGKLRFRHGKVGGKGDNVPPYKRENNLAKVQNAFDQRASGIPKAFIFLENKIV